jgi:hypothetical protein
LKHIEANSFRGPRAFRGGSGLDGQGMKAGERMEHEKLNGPGGEPQFLGKLWSGAYKVTKGDYANAVKIATARAS